MPVFCPPEIIEPGQQWPNYVFLAGSIDMGVAENWQQTVIDSFANRAVTFCNPRRKDWDSTWEQDISNACFREQVEWELYHLERANIVIFHFDPNGKAPITLFELGKCISDRSKLCLVSCPEGYWRRGNIQIICHRYGIPLFANLADLIENLRNELGCH